LETLATQDLARAVESATDTDEEDESKDEAESDEPTLPSAPSALDFNPAIPTPAKQALDSDI
jgi:hypothetical protein